ncbi:MAG: aminopeptidase P family N-terminal domain-containing protein [Acidimicrobiales bacterium]
MSEQGASIDRSGLPELVPCDVASRVARVRSAMAELGVDWLVVTKPVNIRWMSGFTGSNGTFMVGPDECRLITDGRYDEQAHRQLARQRRRCRCRDHGDPGAHARRLDHRSR